MKKSKGESISMIELSEKLDKLLILQERILTGIESLGTMKSDTPKFSTTVSTEYEENQQIEEMMKVIVYELSVLGPHKKRLQKEFNLLVPPHSNRVKTYLKTNDSKVFDGLRRNK